MSAEIRALEPKALWNHFANILSRPHPSGHETLIKDYLVDFAKEHGFECNVDSVGNVIIKAAASKGKENNPRIILQAHMDMVPVREAGSTHDFLKDPIDAYIDGPWVRAKGTTLGADDGIGECTILALLEDKTLSHGPITAIFTVEEETTMKGAQALDAEHLKGDYLINLDSEDNGFLFVSCAGSCDVNVNYSLQRVQTEDTKALNINLSDFAGGHSGSDINRGNANAINVMAAILDELSDDCDFFLQDIKGGQVRNAICSQCSAIINVSTKETDTFIARFNEEFAKFKSIYAQTDSQAKCTITDTEVKECASYADTMNIIHLVRAMPIGPLRMSDVDNTVVETSCNFGLISMDADTVKICMMPRSLKEEALDDIIGKIKALSYLLDNVEVELEHRHACWSSPSKNKLIDTLNKHYQDITGNAFKITAIHAGLECASFAQVAKDLQLISVGSTIRNPHSAKERCDIKGTAEIYETVRRTLDSL